MGQRAACLSSVGGLLKQGARGSIHYIVPSIPKFIYLNSDHRIMQDDAIIQYGDGISCPFAAGLG